MNTLEILNTATGYIAVFSGTTGMGEEVSEEEAHNIQGDTEEERAINALIIWGAISDETTIKHS